MKVKNILVDNIEIFINDLQNELINNNITHLIIEYGNNYEVHMENTIYRLIDMKSYKIIDIKDIMDNIDIYDINAIYPELLTKDINHYLDDGAVISFAAGKKERPGFKKYTKQMIKQDSKQFKTNKYMKR